MTAPSAQNSEEKSAYIPPLLQVAFYDSPMREISQEMLSDDPELIMKMTQEASVISFFEHLSPHGRQRRREKWVCNCGAENISSHCAVCGCYKPAGWVCECGTENKNSFCVNCGRKRK